MKDITILLIANNCNWSSWPEKIKELRDWYSVKVNLDFTLTHTSFENIPMSDMTNVEGATYKGINPTWYDENVSILATGYDIVLFVLPLGQWGSPIGARGWRADSTYGAVELQVGVDENETVYYPQFGKMPAFYQYARHEIMHAMYTLCNKEDRCHYWWNLGQFDKALDDIDFSNDIIITGDIWGFIKRFFEIINGDKTKKWADAIQEFEGWAIGTRSQRNNNPGNLRFTDYTRSLGAFAGDDKGFCIFKGYDAGYAALKQFLTDAKDGKLKSYRSDMTLLQFYSIYAPDTDHNDSLTYASFIAKRLGVDIDTKINSL